MWKRGNSKRGRQTPKMSGTNRFVARAEAWAQLRLSGTSYEYSVSEDPYDSSTDPSKRQLVVKFSKPSKECPVAPASAKVTVIIHAEKTNYVVKGYMGAFQPLITVYVCCSAS